MINNIKKVKEKQIEKNSSVNTNTKSELKELFEYEKLKT